MKSGESQDEARIKQRAKARGNVLPRGLDEFFTDYFRPTPPGNAEARKRSRESCPTRKIDVNHREREGGGGGGQTKESDRKGERTEEKRTVR